MLTSHALHTLCLQDNMPQDQRIAETCFLNYILDDSNNYEEFTPTIIIMF